ncbi:MAG: radical SAM family heme chaperone HemW [Alphaproteobacteria bacterium]|nr:radical SAM family heme chaperone HemW [Alphaproteobacteria bacterium]
MSHGPSPIPGRAPSTAFDPVRGFGVYVHWPYCARVCPYCDFNVYAAKSRDTRPLIEAILADLGGWRDLTGERAVDAVFLGGGTPSLLAGADTARLIERIDALWGLGAGAEITLEANPDDSSRFADQRAAGVNRLSLGVQSLRDNQLKFLGRTHSAAEARAALERAQSVFASTSLDLIYALPGQTLGDWRTELGEALLLGADHLSLYELTIEPGAAFARAVKRQDWTPADDDKAADLYELTQDLCDAAGYPAYEISNHARGVQHQSRHNRIYWRSGDWAAVGPGAHGRLTADGRRLATEAAKSPGAYVKLVAEALIGWSDPETLTLLDQARERLSMGLRVIEGIAVADIEALGFTIDRARLDELAQLGMLTAEAGRVALTRRGRLAADRVVAMISP